jgi:hypothetical protein
MGYGWTQVLWQSIVYHRDTEAQRGKAASFQLSAFGCQLFEYRPSAIDMASTWRLPAQNLRGPQRKQELELQRNTKSVPENTEATEATEGRSRKLSTISYQLSAVSFGVLPFSRGSAGFSGAASAESSRPARTQRIGRTDGPADAAWRGAASLRVSHRLSRAATAYGSVFSLSPPCSPVLRLCFSVSLCLRGDNSLWVSR